VNAPPSCEESILNIAGQSKRHVVAPKPLGLPQLHDNEQ
jgi:hypothetical protein